MGQITGFYKLMVNPWTQNPQKITRDYLWDGAFNINVLLHNRYISVLSFNPLSKSVTLIILPGETYLDLAHDFGKWQLRSAYNLGQSSEFGGDSLLANTLSLYLGAPIDGFIRFNDKLQEKTPDQLIDYLRQNPLSIFDTLSNIKTDLSPWELIKLKISLSSVRFDKVKSVDFGKDNILESSKLADGTSVFTSDLVKIDSVLSDFIDPKIRGEALTVAVYNATAHPLLAQKAARLITNIGGNVIITGNSDIKSDKTFVYADTSFGDSATVKRLTQIFNPGCLQVSCDKINPAELGLSSSRAQINLILGEDYYRKLF